MSCTMSTPPPVSSPGRNVLCHPARSRSRSLNDLPGGLKVPLLKRPERLKPRIQAVLAGLDELRLLKDQHKTLVDEAKYGDISNTDYSTSMQDLFTQQAYEWLSNCRSRLSVSNLEKISEETVKEESSRPRVGVRPAWEIMNNNHNQVGYKRQTRRPVSFSGYPGPDHIGRSASFRYDLGHESNRLVEWTNPLEKTQNQSETFSTMRRASFQCHAVLTRQKGEMSALSASREYPSPMHAVLRQYHPKIDVDDKKLMKVSKDNTDVSSTKTKNQVCSCVEASKEVTVNRRSSFTVGMNYNKDKFEHYLLRRANSSDLKKVNERLLQCSSSQIIHPVEETQSTQQETETHKNRYRISESPKVSESNQKHIDNVSYNLDSYTNQDRVLNSKENSVQPKSFPQSPKEVQLTITNTQPESSVRRNIANLDRNKIQIEYFKQKNANNDWNIPCHTRGIRNNLMNDNTKLIARHNSQTENDRQKSFHISKGDNLSFTSDEGYGASVASTPRGRRQLSIYSDASWLSTDTHDNRSCDLNYDNNYKNSNLTVNLTDKSSKYFSDSRRKVSTRNCNSNTTPFKSKVLPFKQTSL
ncbi:hypothetical protein Ahia01_000254300 [Argonauta hians]